MKLCILIGSVLVNLLIAYPCFPAPDIQVHISGPTSSPDGNRIAFVVLGNETKFCVLDLTTKEVKTIPFPGYNVEAFYGMSWGPDGRSLIATIIEGTRESPGPFSIWQLDLESSQWSRISELDTRLYQRGLISPDGKKVLFRDGFEGDLVVVDLDSGQQRFLTGGGLKRTLLPFLYFRKGTYRLGYDWTPDGKTVFYSRGFWLRRGGIWSIRADGTDKKILSKKYEPYSLGLSKSGTYLAFVDENTRGLYVSSLSSFHPIVLGRGRHYFISWAPHQDLLAFRDGNSVRVWTPSPDGATDGESVEIANGEYTFPFWTRKGKGVAFMGVKETSLLEFDFATGVTTELYSIADHSESISVGETRTIGDSENP